MEKVKSELAEKQAEKLKNKRLQGRPIEEDKSGNESEEEDGDAREVFDKDGFYDVPQEFEDVEAEDEELFAQGNGTLNLADILMAKLKDNE